MEEKVVITEIVVPILGLVLGAMSIPLAWVWARLTSQHRDLQATKDEFDKHRLYVARKIPDKEEVRAIVEDTSKPIKDSIKKIEHAMEKMADRRSSGSGQ